MCYSIFSSVCLQAFTLPHPLHFYCLYRQRGGYWGPSGHLWDGIYPSNKCGVQHAHAVSNTFSGSLLYSECISLSASAAHCILCCITLPQAMFEVTTVLSQWRPYKKAVYPGTSAPRYACKQTWLASECFLSLQAPTSIPGSLPRLTSFHSKDVFIINLVPSLFLAVLVFFLIFK